MYLIFQARPIRALQDSAKGLEARERLLVRMGQDDTGGERPSLALKDG